MSDSPGRAFVGQQLTGMMMRCITSAKDTKKDCICTQDVRAKTQKTKPRWQSEDLACPGCHRGPHFACLCPSHSPSLSPRLPNQSCISTGACQASCCRALCPITTTLIVAALFQEQITMHTTPKSRILYHAATPKSTILYHVLLNYHAPHTPMGRARQAHAQIASISAYQTIKTQQKH